MLAFLRFLKRRKQKEREKKSRTIKENSSQDVVKCLGNLLETSCTLFAESREEGSTRRQIDGVKLMFGFANSKRIYKKRKCFIFGRAASDLWPQFFVCVHYVYEYVRVCVLRKRHRCRRIYINFLAWWFFISFCDAYYGKNISDCVIFYPFKFVSISI